MLAGCVVAIGLAELVARLPGIAPQVWPRPRTIENAGKRFALDCYPSDPGGRFPTDLRDPVQAREATEAGGWAAAVLEEMAAELPHCVPLEYNELTYRDGRFAPAAAGTATVLVVGDSFTEGQGVVADRTFPRRLEALLARRADLPPSVVRNGGRRGRDQPAIADSLETLLPIVKPDVVVYAFVLNDFEQDEGHRARQDFLNDLVLDRQHTGRPTWKLPGWIRWSALARLVAAKIRTVQVTTATRAWYAGMTGPDNADGWRRTRADLERMDRAATAAGARFIVAIVPLLVGLDGDGGHYPFRGLHEDVGRACRERSIPVVDLLPALAGRKTSDLWVHPVDMHPNDVAHSLIAEALLPAVVDAIRAGERRP